MNLHMHQMAQGTAVKHEYLAAIIFGGFSNMTIWQRINLAISNIGISKNSDNFIW